jgi:murein DD-endopeptidase MepM/ murein hydrolase activator NlpD
MAKQEMRANRKGKGQTSSGLRWQRLMGSLLLLVPILAVGIAIATTSGYAQVMPPLPAFLDLATPTATTVAAGPSYPGDAVDLEIVDPTPMRFVFSTSVPPPGIGLRPPPYPAPWALIPTDHFYFARPILSGSVNWPNQEYPYGGTYYGQMNIHAGVDMSAEPGTPVYAAGSGEVVWSGWGLFRATVDYDDPYGLAVCIRHDFGYQGQKLYTVYAHLESSVVWPGQIVRAGELIGHVGDTGKTTGAHLHFEVRVGSNDYYSTRNPELWIVPFEGYGVLAGRIENSYGRLFPEQQIRVESLESGRSWYVWTYAWDIANSDDHYGENFAISDLPAGLYQVQLGYCWKTYTTQVMVYAGRTTVIGFKGLSGFVTDVYPTPESLSEPPF